MGNQTRQRIQKPTITLRGIGGDKLNVVGQAIATIGRENYSKTAVILVQLSTPVDILLGTDLQPCLGLLLLKTSQKGPAENMLTQQHWSLKEVASESSDHGDIKRSETTTQSPVIRLVQATRLPANHARAVKAVVEGLASKEVQLIEPSEELRVYPGFEEGGCL